ncbi:MAG: hypothetical protein IT440_10570 [Phycisphaeraceae bacterium]|nr:hypothetical protein [Phycisphaeraceae bacterium]
MSDQRENKERLTVTIDRDILQRIDAVATAREEPRSRVIERICRNGIKAEEEYLSDLEKPALRFIAEAITSRPALVSALARVIGEQLTGEEMARIRETSAKQAVLARERQQRKRQEQAQGLGNKRSSLSEEEPPLGDVAHAPG